MLVFLGPALSDLEVFLVWGYVAFFVGPLAGSPIVWALITPLFYWMLTKRSFAPWITAVSFVPVFVWWPSIRPWLPRQTHQHWTEDVRLADGSVVVVARSARVELAGGHQLDTSMNFSAELADLPELRGSVEPLVLYRDERTDEWVIVATTSRCEVLDDTAHPRSDSADPPSSYFEFRARNGAWVQTPLSAGSIGQQANLLGSFRQLEASHRTRRRQAAPATRIWPAICERDGTARRQLLRTDNTQAIWDVQTKY